MYHLVESHDLLRQLIRRHRDLAPASAGKIHGITHDAVAQMMEQANVIVFYIFP